MAKNSRVTFAQKNYYCEHKLVSNTGEFWLQAFGARGEEAPRGALSCPCNSVHEVPGARCAGD
eukprot:6037199-Prorocentrum_lima.AAC.1